MQETLSLASHQREVLVDITDQVIEAYDAAEAAGTAASGG